MHARAIDLVPWLRSIRPLLTLVDPVAVALAALLVHQHVSLVSAACAAVAATVVSRAGDLHRSRLVLSVIEELPRLALAAVSATVTLAAVAPLGGAARPDYAALAVFAGSLLGLLALLRAGLYTLVHALRRSGRTAHPVIVVGSGAVGRRLVEAFLTHRAYGLTPVGMIDCGPDLRARDLQVPLLGGVDRLEDAMADLGVDDVIFAFPGPPDHDTIDVVRRCVQSDHQVFVVPRFFEMMGVDHHRRTELVRDIAVMRLRRSGLRSRTLFLKRVSDVVIASVAMVLLAPLMLFIALAVRLETGPGVVFRQTRVGLRGRTFTLLKFRSLRPSSAQEGATTWSIDHDDRIGPVGRFIRRTSLDELPQLLNVWRGDMSLVGPRPERPHFVREFSRSEDRYAERHRVPTGMTGWAQVNDLRGDTSIGDRVRFDNYYIENWSLWGDVKIMFRTLRAVVRPTAGPPRTLVLTPVRPRQERAA